MCCLQYCEHFFGKVVAAATNMLTCLLCFSVMHGNNENDDGDVG